MPAPIEFNDYISPACLTNPEISVAVGEKAVGNYFYFKNVRKFLYLLSLCSEMNYSIKINLVTGWGLTDEEYFAPQKDLKEGKVEALLRQTDVVFRPKTDCADFLTERQLCAGISSPVVHDACQVNFLFLKV